MWNIFATYTCKVKVRRHKNNTEKFGTKALRKGFKKVKLMEFSRSRYIHRQTDTYTDRDLDIMMTAARRAPAVKMKADY